MFDQRTSVGLDVHARSIVAAIDEETGESFRSRMGSDFATLWSWLPQATAD